MEKPEQVRKAAIELDKFKRRLIRAVARLLVNEKKPEEEIWKELKKETGCDCELLWARMRALTVKKLNRLFLANDCTDAVPAPARMSLTDWLMFDLVLVHQKIDLIGQDNMKDNKEDPPVLVELLEVVKLFNIENLRGDNLAEAWSLATLFYNNSGHQCSPMLLQRRWYQLREVTRFKFYDFWYAYRGNTTRISHAEPFKPTPLQTEIAKTFKSLITKPFLEWEEMIEQRLVTMPEEFEQKMKERAARKKPAVRKSSIDVPDLVMIEPRIDTIDLRLEPDDNATEENKQEEEGIPVTPLVKIKQEPRDAMEEDETPPEPPKKSMFEVVLESTDLENLQIDSMDVEEFNHENNEKQTVEIEETVVSDEEESVLPQIGSVFGNVTDTSVLANIDEDRVYATIEHTGDGGNVVNADDTNINTGVREMNILEDAKQNVCGNDEDAGDRDNTVDGSEKVKDNCENMDQNSARNNDQVIEVSSDNKDDVCNIEVSSDDKDDVCNIEVSSDDKDDVCNIEVIQDTVRDLIPDASDNIPDEINDISDDDYDMSGNVDSSNFLGRIDETSIVGNVVETSVSSNIDKAGVFGSVEVTNVIGSGEVTNVIGSGEVTNVIGSGEPINVIGSVDVTNGIGSVDVTNVIGNRDETGRIGNIENERQPIINENIDDINAQTSNSTVTKTAEVTKDVEIIDNPSHPVVIIDSDEEDDIVDDLTITKDLYKTTEVNTTLRKTTENLEVPLTEPLKVCEDNVDKKIEMAVKTEVNIFKFGELPPGIIFADEGIEIKDEGMVYFDEDSQDETDNECKEDDEDTPKFDPKLLLCPVVYTTRLDNMGLFHTQPFNHINDKQLLDAITNKSKPLKKETNKKDTVNNYSDEKTENVTVNENKEMIEHVPTNANSIDDNSILVKEEPLSVSENITPEDQIVPIEKPEDDYNVTSDNSDCDDSVDESLKVKPTSVLLQKPRSRRYNPIQLCKNPDFNTRLKRLSVGFFSSPRNRLLIKSCKPLTIDLSKTFESKLISGTLYLKPADHNVKMEVIDDTESHSVSVVPSAMPAQSLIDNSKVADILPMLHQCLEASKQTVDVAPTSERNKVINLPDITEIRRINQRLLTAEVTPIQVQNNQPQVPVTIVTSQITSTYCPQQTLTTAETVPDSRPTITEGTDITSPHKLVEIIDDSPAKSTEHTPSSGRVTDLRFIDGFRPRQSVILGRPPKFINGKRANPLKGTAWKPRQFRPQIPWLSKSYDATVSSRMLDETLLTLDALNKMLFILTDEKAPTVVPPKNLKKVKRKNFAQQTQRVRPKLYRYDDPANMEADKEEPVPSDELNTKCQKPRINIKSATNYPPDKDKSIDTGSEQAQKKIQYCCWARQRMLQLLFRRERIPRHDCGRLCRCCCRHLLKDYILQDEKMKRTELQIIKAPEGNAGNVTLVRGGRGLSVNTVRDVGLQTPVEIPGQDPGVTTVQVSGEETVVPVAIPVIDVDAANTKVNTNKNVLIEHVLRAEDDVPSLGSEVSVTTTAVVPPLAVRDPVIPIKAMRKIVAVPILKNQAFTSGVTAEAVTPPYQYTCTSSDNQSKGMIINATTTPNTTITPNIISSPTLTKLLAVKKSKAPNTPTLTTPYEAPKHIREKIMFLSSKQISEQPTACPLHLGKNKILLTTIKFPFNLKLFHDAKKAFKSSLNLPTGVHIILLADGTVSYKIDPNVEVNATDMKEMPEKIAAVRAHMDIAAAQELALNKLNIAPTPAVTECEVVDLVDDEPAPNENETLAENVTINIDDSHNRSHTSQMDSSNEIEENRIDSSISANVIATESNQNVDQNIVIDIQENIQESTKIDMLSASTGPLQGQPDSSNKVTADIDHQPKPSSQIKSTEVQEVSAEQSQHQPDPSSQLVSAELDLAKTSNQVESVREILTEQSETSGQNTTIEVLDLPEPTTQIESIMVPEESTSEVNKAKPKNILSDLMEMSGIFEEDMTPENDQTTVHEPEVVEATAQGTANLPICQGTATSRPILLPAAVNCLNPGPPKIQTAIGELTAITSLYELKYACANKGIFFKLDLENGYLVPINVCMKGTIKQVQPRTMPNLRNLAPKSVIDLTEDDDISEQQDTSPGTSQSVRSLLLVNNLPAVDSAAGPVSKSQDLTAVPEPNTSGFTGPARPVKMFKALKPSILQRLNLNKINQKSKNFNSTALDHKRKRKQFLRKINLNADSDDGLDSEKVNRPVLMRPYLKKIMKRDLMGNKPTATTSRTEPNKEFATTILSDDSSDDEPLAKIAKRKNENMDGRKSVTKENESVLPLADSDKDLIEAPVAEQMESELPVPVIENVTMNDDDNDNIDNQAPVDKQNESELPADDVEHYYASGCDSDSQMNELPAADTAADAELFYMSDGENGFLDPDAPFGFDANDSNEEDEDHCILGV